MRYTLKVALGVTCFLTIASAALADRLTGLDKVEIASGLEMAPLAELTPRLKVGGRVHLKKARLAAGQMPVDLDLVRFEVFTNETEIHIQSNDGERIEKAPANVYLRGRIAGNPRSLVVLSFNEDGSAQGLASWQTPVDGERIAILEGTGSDGFLRGALVDPDYFKADVAQFSCDADLLEPELPETATKAGSAVSEQESGFETLPSSAVIYTARLAIETDYELYLKFNSNTTAMVNYIGNVFAFISGIYEREVNTNLIVTYLEFWEIAGDPWNETAARCALRQFGEIWNRDRTGVSRTIAHFMSGKSTGGLAWIKALCKGAAIEKDPPPCTHVTTTNYVGDYGFTGGIKGNFNPSAPSVVGDIKGLSHEIGHNFNSPHTHCYNGKGGSTEPIDMCFGEEVGCYSGTPSLPGAEGTGSGTIMSYCNHLPGGLSNISLNFGVGHPYGVLPERVAARMKKYLATVSASSPGCLRHQYQLNVTKAGTGSGKVTSSPAAIDCGATCKNIFDSGTSVTLTASAPPGSTFDGWSGSNCAGTGACIVAMTQARAVTATFNSVPTFELKVTKSGPGIGTVKSNPAAISCGAACTASYYSGTSLTLSASAGAGSTFVGWSGAGCSGTDSCTVTMTQSRSVTATFEVSPWLIQRVCVDANDETQPLDPYYGCGAGNTLRALRPGDRLPYHKYDAAYAGQIQRHDSYPLITPGGSTIVVNPFAFGSSPTDSVLNQFKPGSGDGYDIYVVREGWASASQTRNGGSFSTSFFSPDCKQYNGLLFFPSNVLMADPGTTTSGFWTDNWEQNGENWPGTCPYFYSSLQTDWYSASNWGFGNTPAGTKQMNTMIAVLGYAPGQEFLNSGHLQVFYFTELYGVTRWEVWTPTDQNPAPGNFSCNGPKNNRRYDVDFVVTACRDWSNVSVPAIPALPAVWPVPDQNLLQNFHFADGITSWDRLGNSVEGNLINWSLLDSATPLDVAHSQTGSGVRYLATNCGGTCSGQQMIYQDVPIRVQTPNESYILPSGSYTLAVTARTQGNTPGTLRLSLSQLNDSGAEVGAPISFDSQVAPASQPSVVLGSNFLRGSANVQLVLGATKLRFAITPTTSNTFDIVDAWLMLSQCANVNAGPLFNNEEAQSACPNVCGQAGAHWSGQWTTTVLGVSSVCNCCQ